MPIFCHAVPLGYQVPNPKVIAGALNPLRKVLAVVRRKDETFRDLPFDVLVG